MEEIKDIGVELDNGEVVPGEVEVTEEGAGTAQKKPTREQIRNFNRLMRRRNSKYAQIGNDMKMKKQARDMRKLHRKPSNFINGAK